MNALSCVGLAVERDLPVRILRGAIRTKKYLICVCFFLFPHFFVPKLVKKSSGRGGSAWVPTTTPPPLGARGKNRAVGGWWSVVVKKINQIKKALQVQKNHRITYRFTDSRRRFRVSDMRKNDDHGREGGLEGWSDSKEIYMVGSG